MIQHPGIHVHPRYFAAGFAVAATAYFWRKNLVGTHESSEKAPRIMQLTTMLAVIVIVRSLATIAFERYAPAPLPTAKNIPPVRRKRRVALGARKEQRRAVSPPASIDE